MQTSYLIYKYNLCGVAMYSTLYSTQVWSASEALPSAIDVSCTVHESRALAEALPSVRSVPCTIHIPKGVFFFFFKSDFIVIMCKHYKTVLS